MPETSSTHQTVKPKTNTLDKRFAGGTEVLGERKGEMVKSMNRTKIEYLDYTWNPIVGCSGLGCAVVTNCFAKAQAKRHKNKCDLCYTFIPHYHLERFTQPFDRKKPSRIGVAFMGELFDEKLAKHLREQLFGIMRAVRWHTFIILTKQPQNIPENFPFPKNVYLGVTVNRKEDLWRVDILRKTTAKIKFISFEPLYEDLGILDLRGIDWIIIGAQTRPHLLPSLEAITNLTEVAINQGIPIFHKNNLAPLVPKDMQLKKYPMVKEGTTP